jgi:hypothetical protein
MKKSLSTLFTMLAFVCIVLVFVARLRKVSRRKISRRKIKEIRHGHVYLNKESNASMTNMTMLRQNKKVDTTVNKESTSARTLTWFPTGEGVTQQLYLVESAAYLAMVTNRTLLLPPLYSYLYKDLYGQHITDWVHVDPISIHNRIHIHPITWKNYPQPRTDCEHTIYGKLKDSMGRYRGFYSGRSTKNINPNFFLPKWTNTTLTSKGLIADAIASDAEVLCIVDHYRSIPRDFRDSIVLKVSPEISLITESFRIKHALEPYVAVHWRTGDVCARPESKGIGTCGDPAEWIDKLIDLYPNRNFYVATDEDSPTRLAKLEQLGHVQSSNTLCLGKLAVERYLCDIDMMQKAEVFVILDIPVGNAKKWRSSIDKSVTRHRKKHGKTNTLLTIKEIDNRQKLKKTNLQEYCPYNITKLQNLNTKWVKYRLSDALEGYYQQHDKISVQTLLKNYEKFGNTLVRQYFSVQTNETLHKLDFEILYHVVKPRLKNVPNDVVVLHLRLGDTICLECWNKRTTLKGSRYVYVYPRTYYEQIIQKLLGKNISTIIISAATYHATGDMADIYKDSMKYVKLVRDLFSEHGYRVMEQINCGTPDEDFVYMSSAKYFVPGGGGYSRTVGKLVTRNGGTVIKANI